MIQSFKMSLLLIIITLATACDPGGKLSRSVRLEYAAPMDCIREALSSTGEVREIPNQGRDRDLHRFVWENQESWVFVEVRETSKGFAIEEYVAFLGTHTVPPAKAELFLRGTSMIEEALAQHCGIAGFQ